MFHFSRLTKTILVFVAVIALGYGLFLFFEGQNQVPQSFTQARLQRCPYRAEYCGYFKSVHG